MLEAGKTIYVNCSGLFTKSDNLEEYVIDRINTVSYYAFSVKNNKIIRRFNKRTHECKEHFAVYRAYQDPESYHQEVSERKELEDLRKDIASIVNTLDLETCRGIYETINSI